MRRRSGLGSPVDAENPLSPAAEDAHLRAHSGRSGRWQSEAEQILQKPQGFRRILGGPGSGKTTLLADIAARRVAGGLSPENLLVLTASKQAADWMRNAISQRLAAPEFCSGEAAGSRSFTSSAPLVRTVHSYAFAVLRLQAIRDELPAPRLLSGPEQDALVRELLLGDHESGATYWPEALRGALLVPGFAEQLRDLLLRAAERGVGPELLLELGQRHDRPEWIAAGEFAQQYEQVTLLRGSAGGQVAPALDAAELVAAASRALDSDRRLLEAEQQRVQCLLVDDAQLLDPRQHRLIRQIGEGAGEFLLAGDPDQAVFGFRGADARALQDADPAGSRTTVLTVDYRMAPAIHTAAEGLRALLPGARPQKLELPAQAEAATPPESTADGVEARAVAELGGERGDVQARTFATQAQQAKWIADQFRRAHLLRGVAWSDMAVLVRSRQLSVPILQRSLRAAGVPLAGDTQAVALAKQPGVRPLLTLLQAAARSEFLDADVAAELVCGPLGGADPLALRRLRRGLLRLETAAGGTRSSGELLVEVLQAEDQLAAIEESAAAPARRVARLLQVTRESMAAAESVEQTLWTLWKRSGLEQRWLAQLDRGGAGARQADRDLDAVMDLFDTAARFTDTLPGADATRFVEELDSYAFAGASLAAQAPRGDAVEILTAHAAAGRDWHLVAIPDVQEGIWPDLRPRGTLLGTEKLVDLLSGVDVDAPVSASAPLLAEERRLFLVAVSRARSGVLASAVHGGDEQPSRFLEELREQAEEAIESGEDSSATGTFPQREERALVLSEVVAELRRVVCGEEISASSAVESAVEQDEVRRQRAAEQLARLAEAGIPGAHPDSWYGLAEGSTDDALVAPDQAVRVSPSTVETLTRCPLRWMLERHGGNDGAELAAITGVLVHALLQQAAEGASREELRASLYEAWESVDAGAPWYSRKERGRAEEMVDNFLAWFSESRGELQQLAAEQQLELNLPAREEAPALRLTGRVDRLEADSHGRPVVVDIKTAKTPVTKQEAEDHAQLGVYQLAAALGALQQLDQQFSAGTDGAGPQTTPAEPLVEPGGARLLYVAKPNRSTGATERQQSPVDAERFRAWLDVAYTAASSSTGPAFEARENPDCSRCPVRASCPVHPHGRPLTR